MDSSNPYTGKRITLISNSGIRYEGTLVSVNPDDATVGLSKVRIFGTEDRPAPNFVPPNNNVFESVLFRGTDIREIALINEEPAPFVDPAVLEIHQPSAPQPPSAAPAAFSQPSAFPPAAPHRDREPSGGAQSGGPFGHFNTGASPRGTQPPPFGGSHTQSHAAPGASERAPAERDREADRFPSRQPSAQQRPPFANTTNTANAAVAPSSRSNEAPKRADAQPAATRPQQPAVAPAKPSTWAGVVTSASKAPRASTSSSGSQNEMDGGRPRGNRDDQRGRPPTQRNTAFQEQRTAGSARGGDSAQRGGRSFGDRDAASGRDRDRPAYAYAPRGGAIGWARGGGGDRDEMGGARRQAGLVGRGGANEYQPQSAGQRGGFGFGFGFSAPQSGRGGYGQPRERDSAYGGGSARGGQSWPRGGGGGTRDATRTDWRAPGPRGAGDRRTGGVPAEYQEEFDFESGNTQLAHELEKLHIDGAAKDGDNSKTRAKEDDEGADHHGEAIGSEDDDDSSTHDSEAHYDKKKSFFDSISSEVSATNKKPNWQKERQVNAETFGQAALRRGGGGGRGGRGRGSWRGPRRGGYGFNSY